MGRPDTHVRNPLVEENVFLTLQKEQAGLPDFQSAKARLPTPFWPNRQPFLDCYWKAWELAFGNLRQPPPESPLVANFIDTAFNDCTFMWDSSFMALFGRYGARAFNFQRTLDNFYSRQHPDGFICREIAVRDGEERFERFDPSSTGPNVMPWAEWEYYRQYQDRERLGRVFPVLLAYTQWLKRNRTWPEGTYWSSGWGCGMDNQPRLPPGCHVSFEHGHMAWIDTTLQQIFANQLLLRMADELGRILEVSDLAAESERLTAFVNQHMWDDSRAFYFDRFRDGTLSSTKTIGAYWALLAGTLSEERLGRFIEHLRDPAEFARPHRVPTLSADHPAYDRRGGYWLGAVWAPTNYMVLRGLNACGQYRLAHEIGLNHLETVVEVFQATGTLWENYSPELAAPGQPAMKDFVGWTGLSPIAILLENVFGLEPEASRGELIWRVRLLENHGVDHYPFGPDLNLRLRCAQRTSQTEEPVIEASIEPTPDATPKAVAPTRPLRLNVEWPGGNKTFFPT
jgi:glycogen debranching enzyme